MEPDFMETGEIIVGSMGRMFLLTALFTIMLCGLKQCMIEICGYQRQTRRYLDWKLLKRELRKEIDREVAERCGAIDENFGR